MIKHLYLHIPFCLRKCHYCDFYSVSYKNYQQRIAEYFKRIITEFKTYQNLLADKLESIYFGGGTPSLVDIKYYKLLFENCLEKYINEQTEISMEMNPATLKANYLDELAALGVNRISVGCQSFNQDELNFFQRVHSLTDTINTLEMIKNNGNFLLNIDLIISPPNHNFTRAKNNLNFINKFSADHVSLYLLTFYEETSLYQSWQRGEIKKLDDDFEMDLLEYYIAALARNDYQRYEISNFCKTSNYCKHNLNVWNYGDYLGLGASAHSKYKSERWHNIRNLDSYLNQNLKIKPNKINLSAADLVEEAILLGLRKLSGIDLRLIMNREIKKFLESKKNKLVMLEKNGFLVYNSEKVYFTAKGLNIFNSVIEQILD